MSFLSAINAVNAALDGTLGRLAAIQDASVSVAQSPPIEIAGPNGGDTLEDVMLRERGLSDVRLSNDLSAIVGVGNGNSAGVRLGAGGRGRSPFDNFGSASGVSSRSERAPHGSVKWGAAHERWLAGGGRHAGLAGWQQYVRESNAMGIYGRGVLNYQQWLSAGSPSGFEYRGWLDNPFGGGGGNFALGGNGPFAGDDFFNMGDIDADNFFRSQFPGSNRGGGQTHFGGSPRPPGTSSLPPNRGYIPQGGRPFGYPTNNPGTGGVVGPPAPWTGTNLGGGNTIRPGSSRGSSSSSSVYVRDEGTAAEVRGLRNDLKQNGGLL